MKKILALGFLTLFMGSQAQAGFIKLVKGSDMVGMEVTVTFADTSTQSGVWEMISEDAGIANLEGFKGGAFNRGFTLTQQGDSQGNVTYDSEGNVDSILGLWTLTNFFNENITGLYINAFAGNVIFDIVFDDIIPNGSGLGREFQSGDAGVTAANGDLLQDELYGSMTVSGLNLADGDSFQFLADTDLIAVSAPTTLSILMLSLFGFVMNARRKQA